MPYLKDDTLAGLAHKRNSLYILLTVPHVTESARIAYGPSSLLNPELSLKASVAKTTLSKASLQTWHRRLGHSNIKSVLKLSRKDMVSGMEITGETTNNSSCKPCLEGKQNREAILQKSMVENLCIHTSPHVLRCMWSNANESLDWTLVLHDLYQWLLTSHRGQIDKI
jgi:hypothetical protein